MKRKIHSVGAFLSLLIIAAFWLSTAFSELFLNEKAIAAVKQAVVYALILFVPVIAATGYTGFSIGGKGKHSLILNKKKRMPFIAANGILILLPAAFWLNMRAHAGLFDCTYYAVQAVELIIGAVNFILISLNAIDGIKLRK